MNRSASCNKMETKQMFEEDSNLKMISINGQMILLEDSTNDILDQIFPHKNNCISNMEQEKVSLNSQGTNNNFQVFDMSLNSSEAYGIFIEKNKNESPAALPPPNVHGKSNGEGVGEVVTQGEEETFPEIGHLENFQISTAEDGTLLPTTVNAKMADGSYQLLTLIPQIEDGNVTYNVQFANLDNFEENQNEESNTQPCLQSILLPLEQRKQKCSNILPLSSNYNLDSDLPKQLENKISSLISENDAVISKCKKVQYGHNSTHAHKNDDLRPNKRLKPMNTGVVERKRSKLSLLKPIVQIEAKKKLLPNLPNINLNSRLEYPNLDNINEPLTTPSKLSGKNCYYNIIPNENVDQLKNMITMQQYLQLKSMKKIQPKIVKPLIQTKQLEEPKHINVEEVVGSDPASGESHKNPAVRDALLSEGKINFPILFNKKQLEENVDHPGEGLSDTTEEIEILVKTNPKIFDTKIGKLVESKFPIGSTKNPIQLIQTGKTFYTRHPFSETELKKLAGILKKQLRVFDNTKQNIFDPATNTRIIYQVIYNEKHGETKRRSRYKISNGEIKKPLCRGRPRLRRKSEEEVDEEDEKEESINTVDKLPSVTTKVKKVARTRSGRLSRPPPYIVKDYRRTNNADNIEKITEESDGGSDCPMEEPVEKSIDNNFVLSGLRPKVKRNFKPEYRCRTCQKIYLGCAKMLRHLDKFPDHCTVEEYEEYYVRNKSEPKPPPTKPAPKLHRTNYPNVSKKVKKILASVSKEDLVALYGSVFAETLSMWDFLLLRINILKKSGTAEVDGLFNEISLLLQKLAKIAEDILFPVFTKNSENDSKYIEIDKMGVAMAFGIPTGIYKVNEKNINLLQCPKKSPSKKKGKLSKEIENPPIVENINEVQSNNNKPTEELDPSSFLNESTTVNWQTEKTYWNAEGNKSPVNSLATKFEPNLSTNLLESSNESIEDTKYETAPVELIDLDSNSKDIEGGHLDIITEKPKEVENEKWKNTPPPPQIWNDNSNINSTNENKTNSQLLESLLSETQNTQFNNENFLQEKTSKTKESWSELWDNKHWEKEERPGLRTAGRLTSTPESNGSNSYNIPNRRNSISDFTNINVDFNEKAKLVLPPAETLIKKSDYLEQSSDNFTETPRDHADDIMNISLDSLPQHDVIVPPSSFDNINLLNQTPTDNGLIFPSSEGDALDFNLSLPDQPTFLTNTNNIFNSSSTISNSLNLEQNFNYFNDNFDPSNNSNFSQCFTPLEDVKSVKKNVKSTNKNNKKKIVKKEVALSAATDSISRPNNQLGNCSSIERIINEALFQSASSDKHPVKCKDNTSHIVTNKNTDPSYIEENLEQFDIFLKD